MADATLRNVSTKTSNGPIKSTTTLAAEDIYVDIKDSEIDKFDLVEPEQSVLLAGTVTGGPSESNKKLLVKGKYPELDIPGRGYLTDVTVKASGRRVGAYTEVLVGSNVEVTGKKLGF